MIAELPCPALFPTCHVFTREICFRSSQLENGILVSLHLFRLLHSGRSRLARPQLLSIRHHSTTPRHGPIPRKPYRVATVRIPVSYLAWLALMALPGRLVNMGVGGFMIVGAVGNLIKHSFSSIIIAAYMIM